jgi:pimeloyl-ACP methyl ester carboxylesterase
MTLLARIQTACLATAIGSASFPALAEHRYQYVDLPGVKLAYLDTGGTGEAVVFVHALAGTSEHWAYQVDEFANAGYRVIAYDRRGWGKSVADASTGEQPGSSDQDLDGLVTSLGLDKFHLVGVAGGTFVNMDYAALHQDKLLSLTLAASTGAIKEKEIVEFSAAIRHPDVKWPSVWLEVGPSYVGGNPEGLAKWEKIAHSARQDGAPFQPRSSTNTYAKLESIKTPTLILAAGADQLAPPNLMRIWAPYVENHEWALIPEAGHSVAWEKPEEFNEIVLDFIARH